MPYPKALEDRDWADQKTSTPLLIGLVTFGILALELALIRWTSSQVRVFAYFNNVVLICAFLGMGLGVALGKRAPGLVRFTLPMLFVLALPLAFSEQLHLVHLKFPDSSIMLWGGEQTPNAWVFARSLAAFAALLTMVIAVFVCAGAPLGLLFARLPALRAYHADLLGSLAGVAAFTVLSWVNAGPPLWLLLGCVPFIWLTRSFLSVAFAAAIVALGFVSVRGAIFSPYNRIVVDTLPDHELEVQVNRDFHQYMFDLSSERIAKADTTRPAGVRVVLLQDLYDLPFKINVQRRTAVVVGAGTGNDVQAALRNGYQHVASVDIDGRIIGLGQELHPEQPYRSPRAVTVVDDARAFFGKNRGEKFDVVCYGLLDSHAMSSAMSTLRLDNYVYTEEGIRAGWDRVAPGGHLSLAISCIAGRWFFDRLYWTIARATGHEPIALYSPLHGVTATFIVPREGAVVSGSEIDRHQRMVPSAVAEHVVTTSDDWPFLYLRPGTVPWGYFAVIGFVLTLALVSVKKVFGLGRGGQFHLPLFLMGAAFLLIETRGVTSLSLLFGSTWIVNSVVFGGILVMVLVANAAVQRWQWTNPTPWFVVLFAMVLALYFLPVGWLNTLPLGARAAIGGLMTGLPIGLAGIIVPMLLARAADPAAALGANLLGAVLGGWLEYLSMAAGLRATALLALALYLGAYLAVGRSKAAAGVDL